MTTLPIIILAGSFASQPSQAAALTGQFRAEDQILLNAVHNGDRAAWDRVAAPDFIYVEEGDIQNRADFLKGLVNDHSEPLKISRYEMQVSGDVALVVHHDEIPGSAFRAKSDGEYLMTETWQRIGNEWQLHIVHVDSVRTDPPAVALTDAQIDELAGTYRSGDRTYVIRRVGKRILATRSGRPEVELKAETRDVLFQPGETRIRQVFARDAEGKVSSFAFRDENSDTVWTRADAHS